MITAVDGLWSYSLGKVPRTRKRKAEGEGWQEGREWWIKWNILVLGRTGGPCDRWAPCDRSLKVERCLSKAEFNWVGSSTVGLQPWNRFAKLPLIHCIYEFKKRVKYFFYFFPPQERININNAAESWAQQFSGAHLNPDEIRAGGIRCVWSKCGYKPASREGSLPELWLLLGFRAHLLYLLEAESLWGTFVPFLQGLSTKTWS